MSAVALLADRVGARAEGALAAQRLIDDLRHDRAVPAEAPLTFQDLVITWGLQSEAIAGFLIELSKCLR